MYIRPESYGCVWFVDTLLTPDHYPANRLIVLHTYSLRRKITRRGAWGAEGPLRVSPPSIS